MITNVTKLRSQLCNGLTLSMTLSERHVNPEQHTGKHSAANNGASNSSRRYIIFVGGYGILHSKDGVCDSYGRYCCPRFYHCLARG